MGVVETINANLKSLLRRYKNFRYFLLKVQRMAALKTKLLVLGKAP